MKTFLSAFVALSLLNLNGWSKPLFPADTITDYYEVETIQMPKGLTAETDGLAVMPDGRIVAGFHRGEIMIYTLKTKTWKLFAEGIHDPLGIMAVSNSEILVMQRPELTRVKDTNGDGVADLYETVTDEFGLSGNYHEFAFGPVKDKQGNIFISLNTASNGAGIFPEVRGKLDTLGRPGRMYSAVPYRGWIMKLTPDGKLHPYASGFRSPNSLGFDANGNLFAADNQGDWLGTSKLYHVQEGKHYGHPASLLWKEGFPRITPRKLPVKMLDSLRTVESVAFPHSRIANSPTQPVLDNTGGKFGPFAGKMLIGEMDHPYLIRLMLETVDGQIQGACAPFLAGAGLRRGNNRLAFGPDGSLWLGQTDHGWAGARGMQRVRWKGKTPLELADMKLTPTGFVLTFTQPLDAATAQQLTNYQFQRYYYEYHEAYGSKQFDKQPVAVTNVALSPDGKTVTLKLGELKAGYIYELELGKLRSTTQQNLMGRLVCYTLNRLVPNKKI
ncbi:MAG: PQQ-dependent sugar dehydrogenase [Larkinella arboricola]